MKTTDFAKREKEFKKLPLSEKRIAIAKDVIIRVRLNQYKPIQGFLWDLDEKMWYKLNSKPLHEYILDKQKCEVCAKGAIFMSCVGFTNDLLIGDIKSHDSKLEGKPFDKLTEIFSPRQLGIIETAYELSSFFWNNLEDEIESEAIRFGEKYLSREERLIAICENLIKNNGMFKP